MITRINTPGTKHLYGVEVRDAEGLHNYIEIEANNRNQAARLAREAGWIVWSVNMIG